MTRRFEGAISTPDDEAPDSWVVPEPTQPRRPASVELAAAILIIGAITDVLGTLVWASGGTTGTDPGAPPIAGLLLALNALTVVVGVLMRARRAWLFCINVVAVLVFVELMAMLSGSAMAFVLAALDGFVFVTLTRQRAWFDWQPASADEIDASADDA